MQCSPSRADAAEFIEEVQQYRDALGGLLPLFFRPARIQNHREALPVGCDVVGVRVADIEQVLLGRNLGVSGSKGISFGGLAGHHDAQIRSKGKKVAPIAGPDRVQAAAG